MSHESGSRRAASTLFANVADSVLRILRKEAKLARAELAENFDKAKVALALLATAVVLALVAAVVLANAGVSALVTVGVPPWVAALIVGGTVLLIAVGFAAKAMSDLSAESLAPSRTIRNVQRDIDVLKERIGG
ncbi:phage holin family protein [Tropicimonas sp. S265A]|uniref:phage holin family protein n=1 Tax=Tropicimonas sp. S265A TaxID=3415134 RepID=UPI003C7B3651